MNEHLYWNEEGNKVQDKNQMEVKYLKSTTGKERDAGEEELNERLSDAWMPGFVRYPKRLASGYSYRSLTSQIKNRVRELQSVW